MSGITDRRRPALLSGVKAVLAISDTKKDNCSASTARPARRSGASRATTTCCRCSARPPWRAARSTAARGCTPNSGCRLFTVNAADGKPRLGEAVQDRQPHRSARRAVLGRQGVLPRRRRWIDRGRCENRHGTVAIQGRQRSKHPHRCRRPCSSAAIACSSAAVFTHSLPCSTPTRARRTLANRSVKLSHSEPRSSPASSCITASAPGT